MTNLEKAIRHIKTRADAWAVKEVEKALSQELCDDAISREAVIEEVNDTIAGYIPMFDGRTAKIPLEITKAIMRVPSVTQKSGKWIETEYHRWRCSVCREKGMSEWDNIHDVRTNFCPDCGADMRGAE